ncbi:MAG TPA: hypothetical protein VM935_17450 [Chitinophagaceae bacterium]|nr:hypothetical protein [Chitinophagaceae bacterium]
MIRLCLVPFCTACLLLLRMPVIAQAPGRSQSGINKFISARDEVVFNSNGSLIGIKYSDISGSPFWKNEFISASLYKDHVKRGTVPVKLNFLTGEVYFQNGKDELVLDEQDINRIVFAENLDSTVFIRNVPNLFLNYKKLDAFVQVVNTGKYQLLKYTRKELATADSGLNARKYFFQENHHYFLKSLHKVERIKKQQNQNLLSYLPGSNAHREWINKNHLDFSKEEDIVLYLEYYNKSLHN